MTHGRCDLHVEDYTALNDVPDRVADHAASSDFGMEIPDVGGAGDEGDVGPRPAAFHAVADGSLVRLLLGLGEWSDPSPMADVAEDGRRPPAVSERARTQVLREYEDRRAADGARRELDEDLKMGILLEMIKDPALQDHLILQPKVSYVELRSAVLRYLEVKATSGEEPSPMDIGSLDKGKGRGKGKPGKDKGKGGSFSLVV